MSEISFLGNKAHRTASERNVTTQVHVLRYPSLILLKTILH